MRWKGLVAVVVAGAGFARAVAGCVGEDPATTAPPTSEDAEAPDAPVDSAVASDATPGDAGDDACTDPACNAKACGTEAKDCQGGPCVDGGCQHFTVVTGQNHPIALRVDKDGTLFWANRGTTADPAGGGDTGSCLAADGSVMRLGPADPAPVVIAQNQRCPTDLLLVGQNVYWLTRGTPDAGNDGQVMVAPKTGGSTTQRVGGLADPVGFAATSTKLFVAQQGAGTLTRHNLNLGGTEAVMATGQTFATRAVAVAGGQVYWFAHTGPSGRVLRTLPLDSDAGAGVDVLGPEIWAQSLIASPDESRLVWVEAQNFSGRTARVLELDGGVAAYGMGVGTYHPMTVTTNGTHLFWGHGGLRRTDLATLDSGLLINGGQSTRAMAVHGGALYWANYGNGTIVKMAW